MKQIFIKFDNYIKNLPKSQLYMLYFVIILIAISLFYNFVPDMANRKDLLQTNVATLKKNIKINSIERLDRAFKNDNLIFLKQKNNFLKQKEQIRFLMSKLYGLEFAFFDEKEWVRMLDNMLRQSLKYNIKIKYVKNSNSIQNKNKSLIKKKKHVEIAGVGNYEDIVKYMHFIESLPVLLKFDDVKFVGNKGKVDFDMSFDTYGIGL